MARPKPPTIVLFFAHRISWFGAECFNVVAPIGFIPMFLDPDGAM